MKNYDNELLYLQAIKPLNISYIIMIMFNNYYK